MRAPKLVHKRERKAESYSEDRKNREKTTRYRQKTPSATEKDTKRLMKIRQRHENNIEGKENEKRKRPVTPSPPERPLSKLPPGHAPRIARQS